jgi:glycosyltransferase involved in cell wall biosynthesis
MEQKGSFSMPAPLVRQVAFIGTYLPRQCGIATFTTHLSEALTQADPSLSIFAIPVNDRVLDYDYPDCVRFELVEQDVTSYHRAADFLNRSAIDVISVQHEYGIFGGVAGSHILSLLREIQMPIVTTLHTILEEPLPEQRTVLLELALLSDRLIVMSERGRQMLTDIYGINQKKIQVIPHGIPDVPFIDPAFYKDQLLAEGKSVLLTFGLLSPNKGIEMVIEALPAIIEQFPNILYVIVGATHPHIRLTEGETYRDGLMRQARDLGIADHVLFLGEFVSEERLQEFIAATDIAITPYHTPGQITSGVLAYTMGAGKAVVSTPYWYAEELLADNRGVLVPFQDPIAIAKAVCSLLENEGDRHAMRKRAYLYGRSMTWPQIAQQYRDIFEYVRAERLLTPRLAGGVPQLPEISPAIVLDHVRLMTDETGMLQHAIYSLPNYLLGYTTDDNARALIAAIQLEKLAAPGCEDSHYLATRYLAFLWHAFDFSTGLFRNTLMYNRIWQDDVGSEDSQGRAIWALGAVLRYSRDPGFRDVACQLLDRALAVAPNLTAPRAWAFVLLGITDYLRVFPGDRPAQQLRELFAKQLLALYEVHHHDNWKWFEPELTYENATLARALLVAGQALRQEDMTRTALTALEWLTTIQQPEGTHFVPVGWPGFYPYAGTRARFEQKPIEAYATIAACLDAYRITGQESWRNAAQIALAWFYGQNDLHRPIFNALTGGCCDGLQPDGINQNQGAESTLALLLGILEFRLTPEKELGTTISGKRRSSLH